MNSSNSNNKGHGEFECLKCGAKGTIPGIITVASKCPICKSWFIVPLKVFYMPAMTPSERRKRFKILKGGK